MHMKNWIVVALLVVAWACGDDSGGGAAACPMGTETGAELPCVCGDGGTPGTQICQADMKLAACDCSSAMPSSTGGNGSGMTGSTGGTGGGAGGTGGSGGMPAMNADGGMMLADGGTDAGGDAGSPVTLLPTDGNQLSVCAGGRDCNKGLDCYQAGGGVDFCTAACTADTDCAKLAGADWTCSPDGLCEVECAGATDTMSCPDGLECTRTGGFGPAAFRCKGADSAVVPPTATPAFGSCMSSMACGTGRICVGAVMGRTGFCSETCMDDADCTALTTSSGNLKATCEFGGILMMTLTSNCALKCESPTDKCPDGMKCKMGVGPAPNLCGY